MAYAIIWTSSALEDLRELARYIAADGSVNSRVVVAKMLDSRRTSSQNWITQGFEQKSVTNVSQQVRRFLELPKNHLPAPIRTWMKSVRIC